MRRDDWMDVLLFGAAGVFVVGIGLAFGRQTLWPGVGVAFFGKAVLPAAILIY